MKITAHPDMAQWQKAINAVHRQLREKTLHQIINRSAGSICLNAYRLTTKAERAALRAKLRSGRKPSAYARAVVIAKMRESGQDPSKMLGSEVLKKINKWIAKRMSAIGYFRFGWLQAVRPFIKHMKNVNGSLRVARRRGGRPIGIGTVARANTWTPEAILENRAVIKHEATRPAMEGALRAAVANEAAMLKMQAEKMLQQDLKKLRR